MKKLILAFLLLASAVTQAQTWLADSLKYWSDHNTSISIPDTTVIDAIVINIEKNILTIEKENAFFQAQILDTLSTDVLPNGYMKNFKIRKISKGESYELLLSLAYYKDQLVFLGLSKGKQFFLYYITSDLNDTHASTDNQQPRILYTQFR